MKGRVLGAIEECMVHYLGVSVALRYGTETGSCIVHKLVEEALLERLPEYFQSEPRNIVSLLSEVTLTMRDYQDPKLWSAENYIRPYRVKVTYDAHGLPINIQRTRTRYA